MPPKKDGSKDTKKDEISPEEKLQAELALVESEKSDLNIELSFLKDKANKAQIDKNAFKAEAVQLRSSLGKAQLDYADILNHKEEQIKTCELNTKSLQDNLAAQEAELDKKSSRIQELERENALQQDKLEQCGSYLGDKEKLEDVVKQQHKVIEKQNEDLKAVKQQLDDRIEMLKEINVKLEDLTLRVQDCSSLKVFFDDICLVEVEHRKLYGDIPLDREEGTLTCLMGKQLLLIGGTDTPDSIPGEIYTLDLETMKWNCPSSGKLGFTISGHANTIINRTKLMVCGGSKNKLPGMSIAHLSMDTLKWQDINPKTEKAPTVRTGHCVCSVRERAYVFGGMFANGDLTNETWVFDNDAHQWSKFLCYGAEPSQRNMASICASEDGRRLYVFGGHDGQKFLNDMYILEIERGVWSAMVVETSSPEPRGGHSSCILGHFMLIMGGHSVNSAGGSKPLGDMNILDLSTPSWEKLDTGSWTSNRPWLKPSGRYFANFGNLLLAIRPDREEKLNELHLLRLVLPDDIERMKSQNKRDKNIQDRLEILDDAICTTNAIEVGWKPPTKNLDRIDRYKMMMATTTGQVKELCQGKHLRYKVVGLRANTEYIFCVKAVYDDGSFLWSDSKAFQTKIGH